LYHFPFNTTIIRAVSSRLHASPPFLALCEKTETILNTRAAVFSGREDVEPRHHTAARPKTTTYENDAVGNQYEISTPLVR
jgi:hypothetical protein